MLKKTLLATLLLSLTGVALAQNNQTFAQQLQNQNPPTQGVPAATSSGSSIYQNAPADSKQGNNNFEAKNAGSKVVGVPPVSYQTPMVTGPVAPNPVTPSTEQAQGYAPQQRAVVQNGQVVQVPIENKNNALPPGAAMALPPDSAPIPLPQIPNASQQQQYYNQALYQNTAMTPEQITELNKKLDARRKALSELPMTAPKPVTGSILVSLNPGATPPLIRPYYGEVTSFVVVDNTGSPWPVENFRVGNAGLFSVNRLDGPEGSAFTIDAIDMYGQSNLVLKLKGLSAPVVIDLLAGQKEQDARVEVRVAHRGPNAATVGGAQLPPGTSASLLPVLDGVTPEGGRPIVISGDESTRGWLMPDGKMIVRTSMKIVSPASDSFVSSADGTNVYVFSQTPTLLGMYNGQFVSLTVTKGF